MKTILITITVLLFAACATEPPEVGRAEGALEYTDGGVMIVDDEASRDEAFTIVTGCPTPEQWWDDRDKVGPVDIIDESIDDPEEEGITYAKKSCSTTVSGGGGLLPYLYCTACCWSVRVCRDTPGGLVCWEEVRCKAPDCVYDMGPP